MGGATVFPESVDNNIELTDGVDIIEADNVNDAYVAIDAIETFVGASGAGQSHNTSLLAQLAGLSHTFNVSWVDNDTIQVSAGKVICQNSAKTITKLRENLTTTDVTMADIDTGAEAGNTWYYLWAVADAAATTCTFKLSTSYTAPTGCTYYRLISAVRNDGSSNFINFVQSGTMYFMPGTMATGNVGAGNWTSIDTTAFVASGLSDIAFGTIVRSTPTNGVTCITNDNAKAPGITADVEKFSVTYSQIVFWKLRIITADTLYWGSEEVASYVYIHGFEINKL